MAKASLVVNITGNVAGLDAAAKAGRSVLKDLGTSIGVTQVALGTLAADAIKAGAAMIKGLVTDGLTAIDAQAKLSRQLGGTVQGLRTMQFYAQDAGFSSEELASATTKLNKVIGQASMGSKDASKALASIGLSAENLVGLDIDAKMALIADQIRGAGYSAEEAQAKLGELGIRGSGMTDAFLQGGDAIRAARQEMEAFGATISNVDAAKVEAAQDAMERIGLVINTVKEQLAVALAPLLQALSKWFTDAAKASGGFKDTATSAANAATTAIGYLLNGLHYVNIAWDVMKLGAAVALAGILTGVDGLIGGVFTLGDAFVSMVNVAIRGMNALGANIQELPKLMDSGFMKTIQDISQAARDRVVEVNEELQEQLKQPLPSETLAVYLEQVKVTVAAEQETRRLFRATELEETALWNEEMLLQQQGFEDTLVAIKADSAKRVEEFSKSFSKQQVGDAVGLGKDLISVASSHSKKAFEVGKAAAIAEASISAIKGAATSLGSYPMPLAAVMFALHLALGLAQVQRIRSQQFSGGGGGGGGAGGAAAATAAAAGAQQQAPSQTLMVQGINPGDMFTGAMVRDLSTKLLEHQANGGKVLLA